MFSGEINRWEPAGDPGQYTTFSGRMPPATHSRPATCEEYGCMMLANGWATSVDERTELGQRQARWIRQASGRQFTEERGPDGTVFTFTPGQECFGSADHTVPNGRPEILLVARGDWRASEPGRVVGLSEWHGRLGEHMEQLITARERG